MVNLCYGVVVLKGLAVGVVRPWVMCVCVVWCAVMPGAPGEEHYRHIPLIHTLIPLISGGALRWWWARDCEREWWAKWRAGIGRGVLSGVEAGDWWKWFWCVFVVLEDGGGLIGGGNVA